MKRFLFRLEPLLNLRRLKEQQALEAFARELGEQQRLEAELAARTAALEEAVRGASAADAPSARELAGRHLFVERCERERAEAAERLALQGRRVEAQRARLAELAREREAVERLRDRAHERHEHEEALRQGAFVDELATQAYARKVQAEVG